MLRISAQILRFSIRNTKLIQVRACLFKVQIAINIVSYWSGNKTSTADIDTVHKCLGNTDLSIWLCFRLADCIFIPWQISHLRSAAILLISSGSSRNAPGMSASVSTVVTEAWLVENYQQSGTVLLLTRWKNSGSNAIKNNCIPYAVKGKGLLQSSHGMPTTLTPCTHPPTAHTPYLHTYYLLSLSHSCQSTQCNAHPSHTACTHPLNTLPHTPSQHTPSHNHLNTLPHTPSQHTPSHTLSTHSLTHPLNTLPHTLSTHSLTHPHNTLPQHNPSHTLSTLLHTPSQHTPSHTLSTHPLNTLPHTPSQHTPHTPSQHTPSHTRSTHTLSTHSLYTHTA